MISVTLCTHNPKHAYIQETLGALRNQTLALTEWTLTVVDNASTSPLEIDLSWHPNARIINEPKLGIAHARRRSLIEFTESSSNLLVFIDDDNILAPDYLEQGLFLSKAEPQLLCWGGQLIGRFGAPIPDWIGPYLKYLAIFPLSKDLLAKGTINTFDFLPPTAGMFLRRELAMHYLQASADIPLRLVLGGAGTLRIGCEDMDIGLCALEQGGFVGRFARLSLTHIMPAERLTENYMKRLLCGIKAGTILLAYVRGNKAEIRHPIELTKDWLRSFRIPRINGIFLRAELRGEWMARRLIQKHGKA